MKTRLHLGSTYAPGAEALHVAVTSDGLVEITANDDGAVVGNEPLSARHVMTLEYERLVGLTVLLQRAIDAVNGEDF